MVPVTRTHVALSNQEADLWFAEKMAGLGATCRVRPTTNPSFNWDQMKRVTTIDPEDEAIVKRTHAAYVKLGALMTYDCTPTRSAMCRSSARRSPSRSRARPRT